jgi:hypothetical protein
MPPSLDGSAAARRLRGRVAAYAAWHGACRELGAPRLPTRGASPSRAGEGGEGRHAAERAPRARAFVHCVSMILPQVHLRNGEWLCERGQRGTHACADCILSPLSALRKEDPPSFSLWTVSPIVTGEVGCGLSLASGSGCDHTRGLPPMGGLGHEDATTRALSLGTGPG